MERTYLRYGFDSESVLTDLMECSTKIELNESGGESILQPDDLE